MEENAMTIVGYDVLGIRRVYATCNNIDVAETYCREEAAQYVKRRPDTGPLSKWKFLNETDGKRMEI